MHLLPEAISNPTTPSGSRSEKPAFLLAFHPSLVIFLSPSHYESGLAASSIFSFLLRSHVVDLQASLHPALRVCGLPVF